MSDSEPRSGGEAPREPGAGLVFDDPLSRPADDDRDEGWGDRPVSGGGAAAADLARFLDEKPPHHL